MRCAKRVGLVGRPFFVFERDLEDRDELVAFDLDLGDVGLDDRFPLSRRAVPEDTCQVLAEAFDGCGAGCLGVISAVPSSSRRARSWSSLVVRPRMRGPQV